jgi:hypothetical protein
LLRCSAKAGGDYFFFTLPGDESFGDFHKWGYPNNSLHGEIIMENLTKIDVPSIKPYSSPNPI